MIYTTLAGRCGNQMFSYAISRKLQKYYNEEIVFCDGILQKQQELDPSFKNELFSFNTKSFIVEHNRKKPVFEHGSIQQKIVYLLFLGMCRLPYKDRPAFYKRQERLQPLLNYFGIYDLTHGFSPIIYSHAKNVFVNGYYEDSRWFNDIRNELIVELSPKKITDINDELYKRIVSSESVCVSIRRGDFLNSDNKGLRDICNEEYYREAIKLVKKKITNPVIIVFSDDIEWVKNNYDFGVEALYESGNDSISEKIRLMSACKHFIVSNSTFSWWAQYLSTSENKIVISPDRWFNMPGYKHQLIEDDWLLIKCK